MELDLSLRIIFLNLLSFDLWRLIFQQITQNMLTTTCMVVLQYLLSSIIIHENLIAELQTEQHALEVMPVMVVADEIWNSKLWRDTIPSLRWHNSWIVLLQLDIAQEMVFTSQHRLFLFCNGYNQEIYWKEKEVGDYIMLSLSVSLSSFDWYDGLVSWWLHKDVGIFKYAGLYDYMILFLIKLDW